MKTYKEWAACYRHLDVYLKPGDEIDSEMVNYFKKHALPDTKNPVPSNFGNLLKIS